MKAMSAETGTADRELLELAAKAAGLKLDVSGTNGGRKGQGFDVMGNAVLDWHNGETWNPLTDDGDRMRLARELGISIDYQDCCAWKRLPSGDLLQEFWGGECGDEAHAVVRVAAQIGKRV